MQFATRLTVSLAIAVFLAVFVGEASGQIVSDEGELIITSGRIEGLAAKLGNRPVVEMTANRITTIFGDGPGVWSYEWRLVGEYYETLADRLAAQGDKDEALVNYYNAMHIYNF